MTRFLLKATLILLVVGIPLSAICWWFRPFLSPGVFFPGYWGQWVHWVKIGLIVLAALWLLRLIIWIIAKKGESKFSGDMGRGVNVSPPLGVTPTAKDRGAPNGKHWYVKPDGTITDTPPYNASEPISFVDQSEFIDHPIDFMTNQRINRLLEEGEITIKEAGAIRRQIKLESMDFLEREGFLSAIEHRPERGRQEHDRALDSILKKYGLERNRFRL